MQKAAGSPTAFFIGDKFLYQTLRLNAIFNLFLLSSSLSSWALLIRLTTSGSLKNSLISSFVGTLSVFKRIIVYFSYLFYPTKWRNTPSYFFTSLIVTCSPSSSITPLSPVWPPLSA